MGTISKILGGRKDKFKPDYSLKDVVRYYDHIVGDSDYLKRYFEACSATGSQDDFLKQNRFYTLYQAVQTIIRRQLPGDVADCGCHQGHATYLMADLLAGGGWTGHLWAFEAAEGGLSDPEATIRQRAEPEGDLEAVRRTLSRFPFVSLHEGEAPAGPDGPIPPETRFSLVHIGVDLYRPMIESLRVFYPRTVKGGMIVIDSYGSTNLPGARAAVDEFLHEADYSLFLEGHIQGAILLI